jgi:hypothetical protein
MGIAQGFIGLLLEGVAKLLDYLKDVPLVGDKIGDGAQKIRETAQGFRDAGQERRDAGTDLLAPSVDKATQRVRDAFAGIGKAFSEGYDKGRSLIDTSDWQQHLDEAIGGVMARVQSVSEQARADVEPTKAAGPRLDDGEEPQKTAKHAVSAIQRIGGGGGVARQDPDAADRRKQLRLLEQIRDAVKQKPQDRHATAVFA